MDVRITSVASSDVGQKISDVTVPLEALLKRKFIEFDDMEGFGQFMVVVVAVDSDPAVNESFCKGYHRVGTYVHPVTGKKVKFLGLALNLNPMDIEGHSSDVLRQVICHEIIKNVHENDLKIPKKFDYQRFSDSLSDFLKQE